jgi:hypothetical protein
MILFKKVKNDTFAISYLGIAVIGTASIYNPRSSHS